MGRYSTTPTVSVIPSLPAAGGEARDLLFPSPNTSVRPSHSADVLAYCSAASSSWRQQMSAEFIDLSNALAQATERAAASAVAVHTEARGSWSGIIWRSGILVTPEHALRRDEQIHATLPAARVVPASLVGRDPSTDLPVLKCPEASTNLPALRHVAALKPRNLTLVARPTPARRPLAPLR